MQAGRLRFRVELQRRVDTQQSSGQPVHTYETFKTVRASIEPLTGREFIAAQQIQADISTVITIRFRSDVDETCRVRHVVDNSQSPPLEEFFDIAAALPDKKTNRRELKLMCVKRSAEGWRNADV